MIVKLLEHTPNPERLIAVAAKLCYSPVGIEELSDNLTEENIQKFLNILINLGHESPLEHCNFTFAVEGISRITEQQLTRHRIASYSIQSGRYVKRYKLEYVIPPSIINNPTAKAAFIKHMDNCQNVYNDIVCTLQEQYAIELFESEGVEYKTVNCTPYSYLEYLANNSAISKFYKSQLSKIEKKSIEDARYIYPQGLATKLIFTMNVRSLLNFFEHRECDRAQWEIRELAGLMLIEVKKVAPTLFKNAGASCRRGKCKEGALSCGKPKK